MARLPMILTVFSVVSFGQAETGTLAHEIMGAVTEAAEALTDIEITKPCEQWIAISPPADYHRLCDRFLLPLQVIQDTIDDAIEDYSRVRPWVRDGVVVSTVVKSGEGFIIVIVVDVSPRSLVLAWSPSAP